MPLIGMKQPKIRISYDEFVKWKEQQGFKEYNYKDMYLNGGENHFEIMVVKRWLTKPRNNKLSHSEHFINSIINPI